MITLEQHLAAHAARHWEDEEGKSCLCGWKGDDELLVFNDGSSVEAQEDAQHAAHVAATWREAQDAEAAEYVGERVDRIIATGERDNESAHDAEDKLLRDLVDSYAPPQVKAHVERLGKAPFARWCA